MSDDQKDDEVQRMLDRLNDSFTPNSSMFRDKVAEEMETFRTKKIRRSSEKKAN